MPAEAHLPTHSDHGTRSHRALDVVATVLLAFATVATAWAGYQASRWHGEQAKAQASATATRLESTRASDVANRQIEIDVALFIQWIDARAQGEDELADFYRARFRGEFEPAFEAWLATNPFDDPDAPPSPLAMPEYSLAAMTDAEELDATANAASLEARLAIDRADRYVLCVVLFATSLFFAGISTKLRSRTAEAVILGLGCVVFLATVAWLATFPTSIAF